MARGRLSDARTAPAERLGRRAAIAAPLSALLAVVPAAPWSTVTGTLTAALLLLPVTALLGLSVVVLRPRLRASTTPRWAAVMVLVVAGGTLFGSLAWLANRVFIGSPISSAQLKSYLAIIFTVAALLVAFRRPLVELVRTMGPRYAAAFVLFVGALALGLCDALFYPTLYSRVHEALTALVLLTAFASTWLCSDLRVVAGLGVAAISLLAVDAAALAAVPSFRDRVVSAAARTHTSHARLLGVSSSLLGWPRSGARSHTPTVAAPPPSTMPATLPEDAPRLVVLVTIDSFRCGFGTAERMILRDVCPRLTVRAREGVLRRDGHTPMPATLQAMQSLHAGETVRVPAPDPEARLARALGRFGYRSVLIATTPQLLLDTGTADAFDEIDRSLIPLTSRGDTSTAEETTDAALRAISSAKTGQRLFVWAHYMDPHEPYVRVPGTRLDLSPRLTAYASEVRRTDAAVDRLIATLDARTSLVFVTADHGEEHGEHGGTSHASQLYEESTQIPFLVWGAHRPALSLPAELAGVSRFLLAEVTGAAFSPAEDAFLHIPARADELFALVHARWKIIYHTRLDYSELYDLEHDPFETHDLALDDPARVAALRQRLEIRRDRFEAPARRPLAHAR